LAAAVPPEVRTGIARVADAYLKSGARLVTRFQSQRFADFGHECMKDMTHYPLPSAQGGRKH
jgi:hypothetical protein